LLRVAGNLPGQIVPIANLFATVIVPGVLVLWLILLPFIDKNPSRRLSKRPWAMGLTAISVLFAVGLSVYSQMAIAQEQAGSGTPPPAAAAAAPAAGQPVAASADAKGAQVYTNNCSGCHGASGQGQPGAFPPLAANPYVTGDPKAVMHTVLYGLTGPIKVGSQSYSGQMPAWKGQLSNGDVAHVITYIRSAWGNKAAPVTEADVAKVTK
jgi:mono/diheme cytochrome c family protein